MATQSTTPTEPQPIETTAIVPASKKPSALLVMTVLALFAVIAGAGLLYSNSQNTQVYNSAAKEKKMHFNNRPTALPTQIQKSTTESLDKETDDINKKIDNLDKEDTDTVQNLLNDVTQFN